ncbi:hypothetical protein LCGC14_2872560 [marine sediment metagenome]|uniref:Uncharacterized protein n=1 Tax=marine sediment metagenome TaxID=412755 RepID=A0A0F9AAN5_9ZZZZ
MDNPPGYLGIPNTEHLAQIHNELARGAISAELLSELLVGARHDVMYIEDDDDKIVKLVGGKEIDG